MFRLEKMNVIRLASLFFQLASSAIQFLASVAERPGYKQLFADPAILTSICEKVIVPNMEFRGNCFNCLLIHLHVQLFQTFMVTLFLFFS